MKNVVLSLMMLMLSLEARENPFEPTIAYMEEEQRILEIEQDYPEEFQAKENPDLEQITQSQPIEPKKEEVQSNAKSNVAPKQNEKKSNEVEESHIKKLLTSLSNQLKETPAQTEEKTEANTAEESKEPLQEPEQTQEQTQDQTVAQTQEEQKPEVIEEATAQNVQEENITEETVLADTGVPSNNDTAKESYDPTPFVSVKSFSNRLEIHTQNKVYRKFNLVEASKIVIDFHADVNFYTKRMDLKSEYFEEVAVGNHKKEKYFRVVVKTTQAPESYKVTHKPGVVTVYIP